MPLRMVSRVGRGMGVLDGVHVPKGKRLFWGFFGICTPIGLNGQNDVFLAQKRIRLVREKLIVFLYGQDIVGIYVLLAFRRYSEIRGGCLGFVRNLQKCRPNTHFRRRSFHSPITARHAAGFNRCHEIVSGLKSLLA